jgi:hypothetical protein
LLAGEEITSCSYNFPLPVVTTLHTTLHVQHTAGTTRSSCTTSEMNVGGSAGRYGCDDCCHPGVVEQYGPVQFYALAKIHAKLREVDPFHLVRLGCVFRFISCCYCFVVLANALKWE